MKYFKYALGVFICILILILAWTWMGQGICNALNRINTGVSIVLDKSWLSDLSIQDARMRYTCNITIQNETNQEKTVFIRGIEVNEFLIGTIDSPIIRALDDAGEECSFTVQAHAQKLLEIELEGTTAEKEAHKRNRKLPVLICIPEESA